MYNGHSWKNKKVKLIVDKKERTNNEREISMVNRVEDFSDYSDKVEDWYNGRVINEVMEVVKSDKGLEWNKKEKSIEGNYSEFEKVYETYKGLVMVYDEEVEDKMVYLANLDETKGKMLDCLMESPVKSSEISRNEGSVIRSLEDIEDEIKEDILYELNLKTKQSFYHNISDKEMEIVEWEYIEQKIK